MTHKIRLFVLGFFITSLLSHSVRAADGSPNYLEPQTLKGTIYADESLKQVLFTFVRTATNSGSTIRVERNFKLPDGKLAAREQVVYEKGQLKSFLLEELQTGARGSVAVQSSGGDAKLDLSFTDGATKKNGSEKFLNEILISDMVGPYIAAHWDMLAKGETVKCRLASVSRVESVGFKFFREPDSTWQGKPVARVTLQPSSIIIAKFVDPMHFIIEKDSPHRVLQYTGRTTPSIRRDGKWADFDAVTVFDWK